MKKLLLFSAAVMLILTSCNEIFGKRVRGNGNVITQNRNAGHFNSVDVSGNIDVYVKQDSAAAIKVVADENLQEYIEVIDDGDVLRIHTRRGFNLRATDGIKVYVSSPSYKKFEASGACDYYSEGKIISAGEISLDMSGSCHAKMELEAQKVSADLSGATSVKLSGKAVDFSVDGSGSTDIKCFDLVADHVTLDISGSGDAEVYANNSLSGDISGAASVKYKGNAQTSIKSSGATSVNRVN